MTMGEAPVWDVDRQRLYWIDVFGAAVWQCSLDGKGLRHTKFPATAIASLALRQDGGAIVTAGGKVSLFDLDSGETELIFDADLGEGYGFNDGTVDRQGRFVTGMADGALIRALASGDRGELRPAGKIYRIDHDLSVHTIGDPIGVTNGPAFDRDGTTFFCNDSALRCVYAWNYDPATGEATDRRVVTRFDDGEAIPDGTAVDDEGYLWIAAYHGGEVRRYAPDGSLDRRVPLPVSSPTSLAFAGSELDVLVVTSRGVAAEGRGLVPSAASTRQADGLVLSVHGLGVRGLPETKFG